MTATKRIADVKVGEEVLSWDGGRLWYSRVKRVLRHQAEAYVKVTFVTGHTLRLTPGHLLRTGGRWKAAKNLRAGDQVFSISAKEIVSFRRRHNNPMHRQESVRKRLASMDWTALGEKVAKHRKTHYWASPPSLRQKRTERRIARIAADHQIPLQYVGEGTLILNGRSPDFVLKGTTKLVEVFDSRAPYFGKPRDQSWKRERARLFRQHGYQVLFLDNGENDDDLIAQRLSDFYHNGLEVQSVVFIRPGVAVGRGNPRSIAVYDLEVEGTHTYFVRPGRAGAVLSHNCSWCDTKFSWSKDDPGFQDYQTFDSPLALAEAMASYDGYLVPHAVVLTGGEPLIWQRFLPEALEHYRYDHPVPIEVETAGTITPNDAMLRLCQFSISHKLPSSKNDDVPKERLWNRQAVRRIISAGALLLDNVVFKPVVDAVRDPGEVASYLDWLSGIGDELGVPWKNMAERVYLMPQARTEDELVFAQKYIIKLAMAWNVRATTRMQIIAYGDERGV